jgi:hypothetical protein
MPLLPRSRRGTGLFAGSLLFWALLVGGAWLAWRLMPPRPDREWRIDGPFGVDYAMIDNRAKTAVIETSSGPFPKKPGDRCFLGSLLDLSQPPHHFRIDLEAGRVTRPGRVGADSLVQVISRDPREDFNSRDRRDEHFSIEWNSDTNRWTARDKNSNAIIGTNECGPSMLVGRAQYTIDHRWFTVIEDQSDRVGNIVESTLHRWLNWPARRSHDLHFLVFDATNGTKINDVPSTGFAFQWAADGEHFWTIDTVYSAQDEPCGVCCRLWPARAPGAPWWLIGGTMLALPIALLPLWRVRRLCRV